MPFKLGILATHPVQYHAPYFRALAAHPELDLTVFYCMHPDPEQQGVGFGVDFAWDIPQLDGYRHVLFRNVARRPALSRFWGCNTPEIGSAIRTGGFQPSTEMHALVVGDGRLRHEVEAYTTSKGVHATFAGFLNQSGIAEANVAVDCPVLPSADGETRGLVVAEVLACGRPAIVSDKVGCHLDLVLPGTTGHVFSLGDVASLASHLRQLALDPTADRALGAGANALVEGRYSIPHAVAGTVGALSSLGAGFGTETRAFAC
jgi:hypothetical protein